MKDCLYWSKAERTWLLACPDDLCHNGSTTFCGLEHGYDFDVPQDDFYDDETGAFEGADWNDYNGGST